ncbi:VWA domain-containing protein [Nocardia panacis]|uniref:VWA domain-containing protein n=1 Tax=Nocardia panacis TaxID=2340916 RepID=A0A3A4KGV2_9NOCA|nr:VWA domain-containing protein [Nocardia panacis]
MVLVLAAAAIFSWFWVRDRADNNDRSAATGCVEGAATLYVTVDPELESTVRAAADRYTASKPQVRDHCAQVQVTARPSAAVAAAFASGKPWDRALGPQPALWIADSSRSIEAMRVPGLIEGAPASLAASPIVLAVPEELRGALEQAKLTWSDLPRLQQGSLTELGLTGWSGLRMAVPSGDGTLAAATAVAGTVSGTEPLSEAAAGSGQAIAAVSALAANAPKAADTGAALATIGGGSAPVHAVAATERQVKAQGRLSEFRPAGAAPVADYPAAVMSGPWVDKTQNLIAGVFSDYLQAPDQSKAFAEAGFAPSVAAAVPTRAALDKVRNTLANPVLGVQATVLLDVSSSMATADGSTTRLSNARGALLSTLNVMPPDFGLGVWTYGKNLDGTAPYKIQVPTAQLTGEQRGTLTTALGAVRPADLRADQAYPTLLAAYRSAIADYAPGRTNSILLITDGPDDDSAVSSAKLLADIAAATDPAHPIRIDIVVIGGSGSDDTLRTLAQRTKGAYTRLDSSDDIAFGTAVVNALTKP